MIRWHVIDKLIKNKKMCVGAEIGVKEGKFTSFLLENNSDLTMYCVDPRVHQPNQNETYMDWNFRKINKQYENNILKYKSRIIELNHFSIYASTLVENKSLDFVFIDAQHDYQSVKNDIGWWLPKIKDGGFISGHDYEPNFPGVVVAVNEKFEDFKTDQNAVWYKWV